jgi:hypothetical protein
MSDEHVSVDDGGGPGRLDIASTKIVERTFFRNEKGLIVRSQERTLSPVAALKEDIERGRIEDELREWARPRIDEIFECEERGGNRGIPIDTEIEAPAAYLKAGLAVVFEAELKRAAERWPNGRYVNFARIVLKPV